MHGIMAKKLQPSVCVGMRQDFWSWGGTTRKFQGICQAFWLYQLGQSHSLLWVGVFCFGISTITIWCSFYIHLSGIEHPWNQQCCFDFIFYYIPVISIITWGSVLRVVGRVSERSNLILIQLIQNLSQRSWNLSWLWQTSTWFCCQFIFDEGIN
jgi:hypothetical protein